MMKINSKYLIITSDYVVPGLIVVGVSLLLWITLVSKIFSIKSVTCEVDYQPCENAALEAEINKIMGVNIFRFDDMSLKTSILRGEYTIRSIELKKQLPSNMHISMQSVSPTLSVMQLGDPHYVTLDNHYRVISVSTKNPNIATVVVPTLPPIQVGRIIGGNLEPVFNLSKRVTENLTGVTKISLNEDKVLIELDSGLLVIMSPTTDVDKQIRLLHAVLTNPTITKGKSEIDVRFAQPILK